MFTKARGFSELTISAAFSMHVLTNSCSLNGFGAKYNWISNEVAGFHCSITDFWTKSNHRLLFDSSFSISPLWCLCRSLCFGACNIVRSTVALKVILFQHWNQTHRLPIHFCQWIGQWPFFWANSAPCKLFSLYWRRRFGATRLPKLITLKVEEVMARTTGPLQTSCQVHLLSPGKNRLLENI